MSLIKVQPGEYYNQDAVSKVMKYCHDKCEWWGGSGIRTDSIELAISDIERVKSLCSKTDGKQVYHLEISILRYTLGSVGQARGKDKYDENACCYVIANEISEILFSKGYQNAFFKHKGSVDEHVHFVMSPVSYNTEYKLSGLFSLSNELYYYLKREFPFLKFDGPYFV